MTGLRPCHRHQRARRPAARTAIHSACADWGFFQVTGHGIDSFVIDEIFAASHASSRSPRRTSAASCAMPTTRGDSSTAS